MNGSSKKINSVSMFLGMFVGSILFLVLFDNAKFCLVNQGLDSYPVQALTDGSVPGLLLFVLKRRVIQWICFFLIWFAFSYPVAAFCYSFGFGVYYGIVFCDLFIKYSVKGILYTMVCFFPYYLFFFGIIVLLGRWFYYDSCQYFSRLQWVARVCVIVLVILCSLVWEMFFQKNILKIFYQHLV